LKRNSHDEVHPSAGNEVQRASAPAADAAGRAAAAAVSLKNVGKAYLVFHITQGNAATSC
jgi:hypothetical protein